MLVRDGREMASWPVRGAEPLDVGLVDLLARLQLRAAREGCAIRVREATDELVGLLRVCGLAGLLGATEE